MQKESKLIRGFTEDESLRIEDHLSKLIPHLTPERYVIVGGLAIRYHLQNAGIAYPQRPFNDLDTIAKDFMIYHFHQKGDFFYFSLADGKTRTKTDIFDYENAPEETIMVPFGNQKIKIVSIEDQLAQTVYDIQRISQETRVDPKQFLDANLLVQIANIDKAQAQWKKRRKPEFPKSIEGAIERAESIRETHPEWIQKSPFRKPEPYKCDGCVLSHDFPLTPMDKIY